MSNHLGDTNKMVGEDHIRDATKMVSDTPRMNSVAGHARGIVDAAIFAEGMKLERELNEANAEIERLTNKVSQLYEKAEEQKRTIKELEEVNEYLRHKNDKLEYGRTSK